MILPNSRFAVAVSRSLTQFIRVIRGKIRSIILLLFVAFLFFTGLVGCSSSITTLKESNGDHQNDLPTLLTVSISPEARVKAAVEETAMVLSQGIWKEYLIEIENAAGITAPFVIESEQTMQSEKETSRDRWFQLELVPSGPLSGKETEFRTLRLKSRDTGIRTAILNFNAGQGTQDLGFRSDVLVTFKIEE